MSQKPKIQYGVKGGNTGGPHICWAGSKYMVGPPAGGVGAGGGRCKSTFQQGSPPPPTPHPRTADRPTIYLNRPNIYVVRQYFHLLAHIVFSAFAPYCIFSFRQPGRKFHVDCGFPARKTTKDECSGNQLFDPTNWAKCSLTPPAYQFNQLFPREII